MDRDAAPVWGAWAILRRGKNGWQDPVTAQDVVAYLDAACIPDPALRLEYLELLLDLDYEHRVLRTEQAPTS